VSQLNSSNHNCICNHAKTIDDLILEHQKSMQILLKCKSEEIEYLINENEKLSQQSGRKKRDVIQ